MKRLEGYRNEKELNIEEKQEIIDYYYNNQNMTVEEIRKNFKLTKRALPIIFKKFNINTLKRNRYTLDESFFDDIDNELKAYLLGYLFADGFVGNEKFNNIVFSQKIDDAESVILFKNAIGFTGELRKSTPSKTSYPNSKEQFVINFSSIHMAKKLRSYGLTKKEDYIEFPKIKDSLIRHFIRGYFDGDGSIIQSKSSYKNNIYYGGLIEFIIHKNLVDKFLLIFNDINFNISSSKTEYMVYLKTSSKQSLKFFYDYFYKDSKYFLSRKKEKFDEIIGRINKEIY